MRLSNDDDAIIDAMKPGWKDSDTTARDWEREKALICTTFYPVFYNGCHNFCFVKICVIFIMIYIVIN